MYSCTSYITRKLFWVLRFHGCSSFDGILTRAKRITHSARGVMHKPRSHFFKNFDPPSPLHRQTCTFPGPPEKREKNFFKTPFYPKVVTKSCQIGQNWEKKSYVDIFKTPPPLYVDKHEHFTNPPSPLTGYVVCAWPPIAMYIWDNQWILMKMVEI